MDALRVLVARLGAALLGLLTSVLVARTLGPVGRGDYALLSTLPSVIGSFGSLGLGAAIVFYVARQRENAGAIVSSLASTLALLGAAYALVGIPASGWIASHVAVGVPRTWIAVSMLLVPVLLLAKAFINALLALGRFATASALDIVKSAATLVFFCIALALASMGRASVIAALTAGSLVTLAISWALVSPSFSLRPAVDPAILRAGLRYGLKGYVGNVTRYLNVRLDTFFVAAYAGIQALGVYAVATSVAGVLLLLPSALGTVVFPKSAGWTSREATPHLLLTTRVLLWTQVAASAPIAVSSCWIVPWVFGREFAASVAPMLVLLPGVQALGVAQVYGSYLAGRGRPELAAYASTIALGATIVLDVLLIPRYGVMGAAVASTIAYVVSFAYSLRAVMMLSEVSLVEAVVPRRGDALAVRALVTRLLSR